MKVSILGNGSVGRNLSSLLAGKGVEVHLGARRHQDQSVSEGVILTSLEEAAAASEIVACALPWSHNGIQVSINVLQSLDLKGKIVIDMSNPLQADWSPILLGEQNSAGQETARALRGCRVIKAFNTIFADMMDEKRIGSLAVKPAGLFCGDDSDAKAEVGSVISVAGFDPVDVGGIEAAFYLEQVAHLNIRLALGREQGTLAALAYLRAAS